MSKAPTHINLSYLYFISFIEGGVVMVTEIAGARMLTPFFGASLYSWASTLSITLLALMSGYYFGGYVTTRPGWNSPGRIIWVFFLSGLTVLLMPFLGTFIMERTIAFSFFPGLLLSQLFFLFLPIFLMGMISPMIIFRITHKAECSGRSAGNIYAISTSGGILFTLVFGFIIVPFYGITVPLRILGLAVCLIGLFFILKEKVAPGKTPLALLTLLIAAAMGFRQWKPKEFPAHLNKKLVAFSEGLLGELKVVDELVYGPDGKPVTIRKLRTNNVQQNYVFAELPTQSLMFYVNFTRQLLKLLPKKETALLIGLGAGSLYAVLNDQHVNVETVEIDKRIYDLGVRYFGMPEHSNHSITDGRYFINVARKKYDLVILDVIIGENVPGQLITLESFKRLHELLNDNGTLIVEQGAVESFSDNSFIPSIIKTLYAAGFQVSIFNPLRSKKLGDVLMVAGKNKLETNKLSIGADVSIKAGPLSDYELPLTAFDNSAANVLTDDRNNIDVLLRSHYFELRKVTRKELARLR